jgi:hypothetical protein
MSLGSRLDLVISIGISHNELLFDLLIYLGDFRLLDRMSCKVEVQEKEENVYLDISIYWI